MFERANEFVEQNKVPVLALPGVFWQKWCNDQGIRWYERDLDEGELP